MEFSIDWLINCLPDWCLQTSVTQQCLRLWAWFFHCSMSHFSREVPFGILEYTQGILMDLPVSSFVCHLFLLTAKSVNLVVACDGFLSQPFTMGNLHIFDSGCFDYKGAFQTAVDSYCCVTGWTWKWNVTVSGNNWGVWCHLIWCTWIPVIIIISKCSMILISKNFNVLVRNCKYYKVVSNKCA